MFAILKFSFLSQMIRRKIKLSQMKIPFWSFIDNLLV
uniref:Uncharacterized protein n=1 Tax=Rhizophora mucronata TaxID=61149 RepID=A0A2P2N3I9_RHIMU